LGSTGVSAAIVNALIGAAADPEPAVRITAVRALALTGDRRAAPALAAHLSDEARLVRVSAAEGLMNLGVAQLDGAQGAALQRAQDEWATSLRTFNDIAADQIAAGWLDGARGHIDDAVKELQAAIALDPADPRPLVYLGVIAARQKQYEDALRYFTFAKKIAPGYQNLDRLIEEVRKQ
jgi:tetratricopeptide (TPR) repeat protein